MSLEKLIRQPVETLPPSASCVEAAELMRERGIGAVVIAEADFPLGMVTDRDLAVRLIAERRDPSRTEVRDVMTPYPVFLSKTRSLDEAITTMREMGVRRLPIVDDGGRLAGMLSMDDVLILMGRQLGFVGEAIRNELTRSTR